MLYKGHSDSITWESTSVNVGQQFSFIFAGILMTFSLCAFISQLETHVKVKYWGRARKGKITQTMTQGSHGCLGTSRAMAAYNSARFYCYISHRADIHLICASGIEHSDQPLIMRAYKKVQSTPGSQFELFRDRIPVIPTRYVLYTISFHWGQLY